MLSNEIPGELFRGKTQIGFDHISSLCSPRHHIHFFGGQTKKQSLLLAKISQRSFIISQIALSNFLILGSGQWEDGKILGRVQNFNWFSKRSLLPTLPLSLSLEREWWIFYNSLFPRAPIQDRFVWNMPIYLNDIEIKQNYKATFTVFKSLLSFTVFLQCLV